MATLRVPPGRAGRLWLRHRLDTAQRGSDLLERKLRILREDLQRLQAQALAARREWQDAVAEAETWLLRADLVAGARSLTLVTNPLADVSVHWTTTMGVYHPAKGTCTVAAVVPAIPGSSALVLAGVVYQRAAAAAVRHAVAEAAVARLTTEVSTTAQRVRALRHRWIPRLAEALARTEFELEELERAEAVRRLRASS
ncbi:V-type ATPase, D subunit [Kibdelosporangium aridum]|uniref:V-type ATPase, D subunit n=1 Tax=Kibdelosporangium aridum TaxID=2030 RepID=A0A428ZAQ1_KIBAR|nr:V-type ATP synthase subunit D [Kibdelosporangium aridum]RSM85157.1 V-type ATPase, D subunit [Kibdelosporangium aridum]